MHMSVALLMLLSCSENKVVPCSGGLEIGILSPIDGSSHTQGEDFQLNALVVDPCRRSLENSTYTVFSDKNQQLEGAYELDEDSDIWSFSSTDELSVGTHQILLRVVNSQGMSGDDSITLNIIENEPPTVNLTSPQGGGFEGGVLISGFVADQDSGFRNFRPGLTNSSDPRLSRQRARKKLIAGIG